STCAPRPIKRSRKRFVSVKRQKNLQNPGEKRSPASQVSGSPFLVLLELRCIRRQLPPRGELDRLQGHLPRRCVLDSYSSRLASPPRNFEDVPRSIRETQS